MKFLLIYFVIVCFLFDYLYKIHCLDGWALICHLYHTVAYHGIPVGISFLEFLYHLIFSGFLILHMHHRIVEVGIEFLSHRFDRLDAQFLEHGKELLINLLHSATKGSSF